MLLRRCTSVKQSRWNFAFYIHVVLCRLDSFSFACSTTATVRAHPQRPVDRPLFDPSKKYLYKKSLSAQGISVRGTVSPVSPTSVSILSLTVRLKPSVQAHQSNGKLVWQTDRTVAPLQADEPSALIETNGSNSNSLIPITVRLLADMLQRCCRTFACLSSCEVVRNVEEHGC